MPLEAGDVYLFSRILHDWEDEQCLALLGSCRKAMSPDSELLIIERAECRTEVDVGIPLGESGPHRRHCGLWHGWSGCGRQVISPLLASSQPYR